MRRCRGSLLVRAGRREVSGSGRLRSRVALVTVVLFGMAILVSRSPALAAGVTTGRFTGIQIVEEGLQPGGGGTEH